MAVMARVAVAVAVAASESGNGEALTFPLDACVCACVLPWGQPMVFYICGLRRYCWGSQDKKQISYIVTHMAGPVHVKEEFNILQCFFKNTRKLIIQAPGCHQTWFLVCKSGKLMGKW